MKYKAVIVEDEVMNSDYLLKPINFEELQQAVGKAIDSLQLKEKDNKLELLIKNVGRPAGEDLSLSPDKACAVIAITGVARCN
ncbi:hypothetical protein [Paraflavitalea speifideaquila]|uniref:hypothetical protein n=1 Tax=Paraflavitalea speifideaquila TaxID=3076558 RepID=UPI0028E942C3|nr:hypothetical protein [Paraflavitalea speifideiaquila]